MMRILFLCISSLYSLYIHASDRETHAVTTRHPDISIEIPATPAIHPSPSTIDLPQLALDDTWIDEEERICEVAVRSYFRTSHIHVGTYVKPFLRQIIRDAHDSPRREYREGIDRLRRIIYEGRDNEDQVALHSIHDMVEEATHKAITQQQKEIDDMKHQLDEVWTKKKAGVVASVTGLISAIISAGVTIAVTLVTRS